MGTPENPHGAAASAMGYLFQCRYALLAGLQALQDTPQLLISIEKFDDVAFEANGKPTDMIQTKHHIGKTGDLSDASVDLWKTIAVWLAQLAKDIEAPFRMRFVLLSTANAPDKSAASLLRMRGRDEQAADKLLVAAAKSSRNTVRARKINSRKWSSSICTGRRTTRTTNSSTYTKTCGRS